MYSSILILVCIHSSPSRLIPTTATVKDAVLTWDVRGTYHPFPSLIITKLCCKKIRGINVEGFVHAGPLDTAGAFEKIDSARSGGALLEGHVKAQLSDAVVG